MAEEKLLPAWSAAAEEELSIAEDDPGLAEEKSWPTWSTAAVEETWLAPPDGGGRVMAAAAAEETWLLRDVAAAASKEESWLPRLDDGGRVVAAAAGWGTRSGGHGGGLAAEASRPPRLAAEEDMGVRRLLSRRRCG